MSGSYLLGIDYGTGSAKACLINEGAEVLAYANHVYDIITEHPGWSEHNAKEYWPIACKLVKQCIAKAGISASEIAGIAVSSALPSMVMVDNQGEVIHNAYNLMDRRAGKQAETIRERLTAERIFEVTANRLEDQPMLVSLLWEKQNRLESYRKIHKIMTIDGYIAYKLTGKFTINYSAAAFLGVAYDIRKKIVRKEMLDQIGIDNDLIPEFFSSTTIIGSVTEKAARESGLAKGIRVAAGQVDCNAGWIGGGAVNPGEIQMNLGTCGNFGIIHKDDQFFDSMIACDYTVDNTYITIPTTTTGGQALRYIRDNYSQAEVAAEPLAGIDAYEMLNYQAEQIKPGSDGLIVLPYLMGERTPLWDNNARGAIFGLSLIHTKAHIVRATMEAVAFALYDSFRIIRESGKQLKYPIVLNEGGAKSRLWREIITDVFNVPTTMVKSRVGAPFGDAILAGVGCGIYPNFSIAKEKAEYINEMTPDKNRHEIYMECFQLFKSIYNHTKEDFCSLKRFRDKHL